jgi:uncharacterized membrane protein YphA (DoxX/SURF4 family)
MAKAGRTILWTGRVISTLAVLLFLMSGVMKLMGGPEVDKAFEHLGLLHAIVVPLAILEISCALIYAIPATSILGAVLLTGYMGGAICTHWRVGDPIVAPIIVGVLVWLGIYLREGRLKEVLPLRRRSPAPGS